MDLWRLKEYNEGPEFVAGLEKAIFELGITADIETNIISKFRYGASAIFEKFRAQFTADFKTFSKTRPIFVRPDVPMHSFDNVSWTLDVTRVGGLTPEKLATCLDEPQFFQDCLYAGMGLVFFGPSHPLYESWVAATKTKYSKPLLSYDADDFGDKRDFVVSSANHWFPMLKKLRSMKTTLLADYKSSRIECVDLFRKICVNQVALEKKAAEKARLEALYNSPAAVAARAAAEAERQAKADALLQAAADQRRAAEAERAKRHAERQAARCSK